MYKLKQSLVGVPKKRLLKFENVKADQCDEHDDNKNIQKLLRIEL